MINKEISPKKGINIDVINHETYACDNCGKQYKHKQSLYRHRPKCISLKPNNSYIEVLKKKDSIEKKNLELSNSINALLEQTKHVKARRKPIEDFVAVVV